MIIVSQDKKVITNFNNTLGIQIETYFLNGDGEKDYEVKVITEKGIYTIGTYDTEERAKEVLQEIIHIYGECNASCVSTGYGYVKNKVYEMPED